MINGFFGFRRQQKAYISRTKKVISNHGSEDTVGCLLNL
jgi:hypothetical protein